MKIHNFQEHFQELKRNFPERSKAENYTIALEAFPMIEVTRVGQFMPDGVPEHDLYNLDQDPDVQVKIEKLIKHFAPTNDCVTKG